MTLPGENQMERQWTLKWELELCPRVGVPFGAYNKVAPQGLKISVDVRAVCSSMKSPETGGPQYVVPHKYVALKRAQRMFGKQ